ncbi:MAG: helix-turn-helix domain-containing protein [Bacteroidales bacterium]|jgi:AraC-like DNA-binding protein|nr:helix-turn-helix domain-containing protein [Bacteroidales bacterium]
MNQIVQTILYLGAIQGFLLSIFLFSIKMNIISNRLLGFLTLIWGIIIAAFALQAEGMYVQFPHLLKVFDQLLFFIFPLLYLQVKYLISNYKQFSPKDLFHFMPWLIIVLLNSDFYLSSGEEKFLLLDNLNLYHKILDMVSSEIIAIQGVIYSIIALRLLSKYEQKIKNYLSNIDKIILRIQYLGISLSLFAWIIGIVGIHLEFFNIDIKVDLFIFVYLTLVLIIYVISYSAIKSPEIYKLDKKQLHFGLSSIQQKQVLGRNKPISKDAISEIQDEKTIEGLEDPIIEEINTKLLHYFEEEKPYLNPELSLQDLADDLDVKRHQLSNTINQKHQKNFYEFVNQYRVEDVKIRMTDPQNKHLKLISLAYDAGFNSKASFNRIFKQFTNMTPSQFIMNKHNSR